jgi:glycosyltransferase involved in cell wall biosynthesis
MYQASGALASAPISLRGAWIRAAATAIVKGTLTKAMPLRRPVHQASLPRTAVVVTTYNRPDALALVLDGYRDQLDESFELIVADDGSTHETADVIEDARRTARFPISHVWQEDRGFRAAAIRNRTVASSLAEYLIFTDGDCVPGPAFVSRHRQLAQRGCFVAGSRVSLQARLTRAVTDQRIAIHRWGLRAWAGARLRGDVNRLLPLLPLPLSGSWRTATPHRWKGHGSFNLAVWRSDFERINGFDESFEGWGFEDTDLVVRLVTAGVRYKAGRLAVPVFHLWHPQSDRAYWGGNRQRFEEMVASGRTTAIIGLDRHRSEFGLQ